jgi:hypothetical protein
VKYFVLLRRIEMPCRDDYVDTRPTQRELDAALTNAVLCAFTRTLKNNSGFDHFMQYVDWKESGFTKREYLDWWKRHELIDTQRREKIKIQAALEQKRNKALSKLTGEERILLGLDES